LLKSGQPRKGAPAYPPLDVDKLVRATGDALSGVVFEDDRQVVRIEAAKAYADADFVTVTVRRVEG